MALGETPLAHLICPFPVMMIVIMSGLDRTGRRDLEVGEVLAVENRDVSRLKGLK